MKFEYAQCFDSFAPDAQQQALSLQWLYRSLESVSDELLQIRSEVDEHYFRLKKANRTDQKRYLSDLTDIEGYTYGYCNDIRNRVWAGMSKRMQHGQMKPIKQVLASGGRIRKIWGELTHGPYLQNAIQIGSYYLDAANDTVDTDKPKLEAVGSQCQAFYETAGPKMRGEGAVDNAQDMAHQLWMASQQEPILERKAQHPLTNRPLGEHFVYQQGRTLCHPAGTTARAKATPIAAECN